MMDTLLNQYVTARVHDAMIYGKVINVSNNGRVVFILSAAYIQPHYYQALARNCTPCEIPTARDTHEPLSQPVQTRA